MLTLVLLEIQQDLGNLSDLGVTLARLRETQRVVDH